MSFSILKEQSLGTLPKPYSVSDLLKLTKNSPSILKIFDTNPNLVALLDSDEGKIVLKRFGWRNPLHFYTSPFKYSRARMSWETAQTLDSAGITPKPLFVYTKKKLGFKYQNFFITKAIEPHVKFRKFLKEEKNIKNISSATQNLAAAIAKMHSLGIYHRDLTTGNFLIDEQLNVYIVDLNRARNVVLLTTHQRLKDLRKVYFEKESISPQDVLIDCFFQQYKKESRINIDWINQYWKYRKKLNVYRKRKTKVKTLKR